MTTTTATTTTTNDDDISSSSTILHKPLVLLSSNGDGSIVSLYENVIPPADAAALLTELSDSLPWKVEHDQFGPQSRATCYVGDPDCVFTYVGLRLDPKPWPESLTKVRAIVAKACGISTSTLLSACLVNHYPKGQGAYIPWHYDEVRAHGPDNIVACLSLGGPRRFQLRLRTTRVITDDRLLPSGSVLLMQGTTQEHYEHCLPLSTIDDPHRISLTFRSIVPGYEQGCKEIVVDQCCATTTH
jgi:alkylated DNA repair dioxygenase AlkB